MLIAAEYPFLGVFLTMILFCAWVIYVWIAVTVLADVFRRRDIGGWAKAAWTVVVIVLPFLGVLVYLVAQHAEMAERTIKRTEARQEAVDQ